MATSNCSTGLYDLCVNQGATYQRTFIWQTAPGCSCSTACNCAVTNAVPVDLTGYTADMQIRLTVQSTSILFEASTTNGNIVLGGTAGTIALTIPATNSATFTFLKGVYDLNLTSSSGVVTRLLQGSVIVSPEVTR